MAKPVYRWLGPSSKANLLTVWAVLRLPIFFIGIYLLRDTFVSLIERYFDLAWATVQTIYFISTFSERILVFVICIIVLSTGFILGRVIIPAFVKTLQQPIQPQSISYGFSILFSLVFFLSLFHLVPTPHTTLISLILSVILAINSISAAWFIKLLKNPSTRKIYNAVFGIAVGVSEVVWPKFFIMWLATCLQGKTPAITQAKLRVLDWFLPVVWVSVIASFLTNGSSLVELGRTLHANANVQLFARGDYNWLDLNQNQGLLYASGHGTNYLKAYPINAIASPPKISPVPTGNAQGFVYNPSLNEIYLHNRRTQELLFLDPTTLTLTRSIKTPRVAPGDSWLAWDKISDNIFIASEADRRKGVPFVVIHRPTGTTVKELKIDPSYIMLHPKKPLLYMNFFRRKSELLLYDTQLQKIIRRAPTDARVDRMAFDRQNHEVLVPSPLHSVVLQYDAETLEPKGKIATVFGTRTLAIDAKRHWLFSGSLVNNMLEVVDLQTQEAIASYYIGPWIRTICLNTETGVAYVSTKEGLFQVQYAQN
jgi:DNA-binding beta-propeller fold protein YncE